MNISEKELSYLKKHKYIAGIDEVGRGPLAGPLVVGIVVIDLALAFSLIENGIDDSKKISAKKREDIVQKFKNILPFCKVLRIDSHYIDQVGIHQCCIESINKLIGSVSESVGVVIVDGLPYKGLMKTQKVNVEINADEKFISVALASVISKVYRDKIMIDYAKTYPEYGFEKNKGYGTKFHLKALSEYGPCPIHRVSFRPVQKIVQLVKKDKQILR